MCLLSVSNSVLELIRLGQASSWMLVHLFKCTVLMLHRLRICVLPPSLALVDRITRGLIQRPRCRLGLRCGEFVISLCQDFVARNHIWLRILLFTVVFLGHVIHIMVLYICRCCLRCRGCGASFWANLPHLNQT